MINAEQMPLNELITQSFSCTCGRVHATILGEVLIGRGVLGDTVRVIASGDWRNVFIIADDNTWAAAGNELVNYLSKDNIKWSTIVFEDCPLVPDERAIGRALMRFDQEADLIIGVGAGTINDIARFVSFRLKVPYIVVATAPSMDGYASTVAPLITNNLKTTYECHAPAAIIADLDVIANAPEEMIAAGFADILGKYTCLLDWKLSAIINGEYYCETVVSMVRLALERTVSLKAALAAREPQAVGELMEALILAGVAMSYVGNSRPASGSEHHLSHFWEMHMLFSGLPPALHGAKVGVATGLILEMYEFLRQSSLDISSLTSMGAIQQRDQQQWEGEIRRVFTQASDEVLLLEERVKKNDPILHRQRLEQIALHWEEIRALLNEAPPAESVRQLLAGLGGPILPEDIGITRDVVLDSLAYAKEVRARYTILQLLWDLGLLDAYIKLYATRHGT